MPITPDEARAILARWQPILRLADWESTTEDLAKALLAASGSSTPLAFGRLDAEVEREIGPRGSAG